MVSLPPLRGDPMTRDEAQTLAAWAVILGGCVLFWAFVAAVAWTAFR